MQTLVADSGGQLADDIARSMLLVGWQLRIWRRTGPERKSIMMLRGEHDIFRASVVEYFGPDVGIPLLDLAVEDRSEVVVIIVSAIMFAMVGLRRRSIEPHAVQIPFCVGVVCDGVRLGQVMLRM